MKDAQAKVISKSIELSLKEPISGKAVGEEMAKVMLYLGEHLNYKGKIIGHLKSIAVSGENYHQMSMTSSPDITSKASPGWHEQELTDITFTVNIIVYGYEKERLINVLDESIAGTVFNPGEGS